LGSTFNQSNDLTEISSADVALIAYVALEEDLSHDMILTERWRSPFLEVLEEARLKFLRMFGHK
jgi:hypothetical protein